MCLREAVGEIPEAVLYMCANSVKSLPVPTVPGVLDMCPHVEELVPKLRRLNSFSVRRIKQ